MMTARPSNRRKTENFRQLLENAGVPNAEHRSRHETRHTVVTILMSMGVDYGLVEEIVGHSSRLMVEHYRHAGLKERLSAMETMNKPLQLDSYKLGDNEG